MNRTWATINLDALKFNIESVRKATSENAKVMAVVKADAYGHGVYEASKVFISGGADCLAVACLSEAKQLRKEGIDVPILILGAIGIDETDEIVEYDITSAVFSYETAKALSESAQKLNKTATIHIKIDTGMSRIGILAGDRDADGISEIKKIASLPNIYIEGIFSHFSTSDELDGEYTKKQFDIFLSFTEKLEKEGISIPVKHIANSAAIISYPEMHLNMVRAGIVLYGLYPSDDVDKERLPLIPAMSFKSRITMVKEMPKGRGVSYGKEYITEGTEKIATVPVGYADGYTRNIAKKGSLLLSNGKTAKIIGRICMDQCMIDVTNVNNISAGDEVTLFGDSVITADDVAKWSDSINYEVVCLISKRVPRVYLQDGKPVSVRNYIDELL
ncbi:MAG: alanine racemase [Clostridia bacterium]|nr:alanine racemase [Clostridia bacterium]